MDQLLKFQRNYVIDYKDFTALPIKETFDYDFLGYLLDDLPLATQCHYRFDSVEDKTMSLDRFLESMYFGRKRNFGKTIITKTTPSNNHEVIHEHRELVAD
jgi:hypothetical protein